MLSTFQEKVHTFGVRRGTLGGWKRHFCGVRKSLSNPIGSDSVSELVWRRSAAAARIPPGPKFSSPSFFSNFLKSFLVTIFFGGQLRKLLIHEI